MDSIQTDKTLNDKDIKFLRIRTKRKWESTALFILSILIFLNGMGYVYSANKVRKIAGFSWSEAMELTDLPAQNRKYSSEEMFIAATIRKALMDFIISVFFVCIAAVLKKNQKFYLALLKYTEK